MDTDYQIRKKEEFMKDETTGKIMKSRSKNLRDIVRRIAEKQLAFTKTFRLRKKKVRAAIKGLSIRDAQQLFHQVVQEETDRVRF